MVGLVVTNKIFYSHPWKAILCIFMGFIQSMLESVLLCMGFQLAHDCKSSKLIKARVLLGCNAEHCTKLGHPRRIYMVLQTLGGKHVSSTAEACWHEPAAVAEHVEQGTS